MRDVLTEYAATQLESRIVKTIYRGRPILSPCEFSSTSTLTHCHLSTFISSTPTYIGDALHSFCVSIVPTAKFDPDLSSESEVQSHSSSQHPDNVCPIRLALRAAIRSSVRLQALPIPTTDLQTMARDGCQPCCRGRPCAELLPENVDQRGRG